MKPTPRTYGRGVAGEPNATVVHADRDLERQLSDALEREKALRQELAIEFGNSDRLAKALGALETYASSQTCTHDDTHRGGSIWEICDQCGAMWADDKGGKPKFKWPKEIEAARTALALHESGDEPTYTDCPIHGRHEGDCPRC